MCTHRETKEEKQSFVLKQLREAKYQEGESVQKVTCFCGLCAPLRFMYRCLYCGEFYCLQCAVTHFGKTREEYLKEKGEKQLEFLKINFLDLSKEDQIKFFQNLGEDKLSELMGNFCVDCFSNNPKCQCWNDE